MKKIFSLWKAILLWRKLLSAISAIREYLACIPEFLWLYFRNYFKINKKNIPTIFIDLRKKDEFGKTGRHFYTTLYPFSVKGYNVNIPKISFKDYLYFERFGHDAYFIKNLKMVTGIPQKTEDKIYVYDTEDQSALSKKWGKIIHIRYDFYSDYRQAKKPIFIPFLMSPPLCILGEYKNLEEYRRNKRKLKIFFSGDTSEGYYFFTRYIKNKLNKLARPDIIKTVLETMKRQAVVVQDKKSFDTLLDSVYVNKCIIIFRREPFSIEQKNWLNTISKCDFFLCAPGLNWPISHNIIESMAVGTIPITNYPEWLHPPLQHMENCIVFDDRDDLINKIRDVLEMDEEKIIRLKNNVIKYYEEYLGPANFLTKIEESAEDKITIFALTLGQNKKYLSLLTEDSVIFHA